MSELRQIACTQCGGPLELRGGHRVRTLNCGHCGAVLDAWREFSALAKFSNRRRPITPLDLGMQGKIHGIEFTVIGLAEYRSEGIYRWVDHQLFSPTHGYAWLTHNEGHFVFSRRVRDLPTPTQPNFAKPKQIARMRGHELRFYETYQAKIHYVEGELTWIAREGEGLRASEAVDPPFILAYEREESDQEIAYQWGEYLPAREVAQSFGLDPKRLFPPKSIHPAQPFAPSALGTAFHRVGLGFAGLALAMLLAILLWGGGTSILSTQIQHPALADARPAFQVNQAGQLMKLDLYTPINNLWTGYTVQVIDANTQIPVLGLYREIAYYSGYEGGESWSEGSRGASALFRIDQPGAYYLTMELESNTSPQALPPLKISLREGVVVARYVFLLLLVCLVAGCWQPVARMVFEARRWGEVAEDDD